MGGRTFRQSAKAKVCLNFTDSTDSNSATTISDEYSAAKKRATLGFIHDQKTFLWLKKSKAVFRIFFFKVCPHMDRFPSQHWPAFWARLRTCPDARSWWRSWIPSRIHRSAVLAPTPKIPVSTCRAAEVTLGTSCDLLEVKGRTFRALKRSDPLVDSTSVDVPVSRISWKIREETLDGVWGGESCVRGPH